MKQTGTLIILAFPDTFVTMSDEWICKLLPLVGLGTRDYIKAGHAALVLIENANGEASYFDFGRYVTPKGYGRVRGANTDAELGIPMKAKFSEDGEFKNVDELLLWLDANPQKTHGSGRLLASVCGEIDYVKAKNYIDDLQGQGSIPYGAFDKLGSNCARFVTDTILASTSDEKIIKALRFNKKFTPSTVGNVEKGDTLGQVYEVYQGIIKPFEGSALKENLTNYFDKKKPTPELEQIDGDGNQLPDNAQRLSGTGSNAWFELLQEDSLPKNHYRIRRYNDWYELDYDGVYISEDLNVSQPYQFTYDSNCAFCTILQNESKIHLKGVGAFTNFSLSQKVRSA